MTVFSMSLLVLDPADAADDVLGVVLLDDAAAGRQVALGHRRVELAQRDAVGPQGFGPHVDLVLQRRAADRGDFGHAGGRVELRGDVELVERPEPRRVHRVCRAGLDGVPEDLAQGGGVGGQSGRHALRQEACCRALVQLFQHPLAGEIEVDVVLEDDRDHREVEFGGRADGLDAGQPLQFERQRIGDLVLDLAGAAAHPVGEDDHLVLAQVGDGVHRRVEHGVDAEAGQGRRPRSARRSGCGSRTR